MQHLEEGEIHAWLDGALSEAEGARIEQHAATCKECAAMVADARGLIAGAARIVSALDHVPSGVIPKSGAVAATPSRPLWRVLRATPFRAAMAASIMVAAASLFVIQGGGGDKISIPPAPMVASAPAVPPPVEDKVQKADAAAANEVRQLEQVRPTERPMTPGAAQSVSKTTLALQDTTLLMKAAPPSAAPAPTPTVASAEDQRVKKERDAIAEKTVVAQAPANVAAGATAGAASASGPTSSRRVRVDSTSPAADIAFRRPLPAAVQRAAMADSANAASVNFVGCYQVADESRGVGSLPSRFALTSDTAGARTPASARSLYSPGRLDSMPIGSWQRLTPTSIRVSFVTVAFPGSTYTLVRDASGITATSSRPGSTPVRLTQRDCPR